jgi:branched-chain amino acid aminotransferase
MLNTDFQQKIIINNNGIINSADKSFVNILDRGFLYGDSIYEVAVRYNNKFLFLEDHLQRLHSSAEKIQLKIDITDDELIKRIYDTSKLINSDSIYCRIIITRGINEIGLDIADAFDQSIIIICQPLKKIDSSYYQKGVKLHLADVKRNSKYSLDPAIKSGNYLNNILAIIEAKKNDAHDSILINSEGYITEGTTFNIFCVNDNKIMTPSAESGILLGVTRKKLIEICKKNNFSIEETYILPDTLFSCQEVFLTSSGRNILPIAQIDNHNFKCPGKITSQLCKLFDDYISVYLNS